MMSKLGKHKSLGKDLKLSIEWLESLSEVLKIVLGLHESARHHYSPGTLRYKHDVLGGIKLNAYSGNGVMDIYIKVKDKQKLIAKIQDRWIIK